MSHFTFVQNYRREEGLPYAKRVGENILCYQNNEVVKSYNCLSDDYAETNAAGYCHMLSQPILTRWTKDGFVELPNQDYKEPMKAA